MSEKRQGEIEALLEAELARGGALSLLMMETDHLLLVQQAYGEGFVRFVREALLKTARANLWQAAAIGAYEESFLLAVLPGRGAQEALEAGEKVRRMLEETIVDDGRARMALTVSIGVADTEVARQRSALLMAVKCALRSAQAEGGNLTHSYARLTETSRSLRLTHRPRPRGRTDLLGTLAVDQGILSPDKLQVALVLQRQGGLAESLGGILLKNGLLTPDQLHALLREQQRQRVDSARRVEEDLASARRVQRKIIPATLPKVPGVDIGAVCLPSGGVCGDFYDVVSSGKDTLSVAVGQVAGSGLGGAMAMTLVSGMLRAAPARPRPIELFEKLNDLWKRGQMGEVFLTLCHAQIDLAAGKARVVAAGHPAPLVVAADGKVSRLECRGTAFGVLSGGNFLKSLEASTIDVGRIRRMLLHTSGAADIRNAKGDPLTERGLLAILDGVGVRGAEGAARAVVDRMLSYTGTAEPTDDITILCLDFKPRA
ncbi:MAG: SpoIIE family protein phosphatase [Planctomycetota bacterium]